MIINFKCLSILTLYNSTFRENYVPLKGGALYINKVDKVDIKEGNITNNRVTYEREVEKKDKLFS